VCIKAGPEFGELQGNLLIIDKALYGLRHRSGCPPYIWFLALSYIIFCLNHCVVPNLADGTKSPLQVATFMMTDISPLLYF
jgi:hypothetical protein